MGDKVTDEERARQELRCTKWSANKTMAETIATLSKPVIQVVFAMTLVFYASRHSDDVAGLIVEVLKALK